jgi:predicted AlkP superfamily phosphohydrolase/phosphomutase
MTRVLIVGWDGADWQLVDRYLARLPNLRSLLERGVGLKLHSTTPCITPVAWPSMFTGLNPGKHGVFDWTVGFPWTGSRPVVSADIGGEPLWNLLSRFGKTAIVAGAPLTFPPKPFRGIMLGSWLVPSKECAVYISEHYTADVRVAAPIRNYPDRTAISDPDRFQGMYEQVVYEQTRSVTQFMGSAEWDLCFVVYPITDQYNHWDFSLERAYEVADQSLGKLLETAGPETCVFLVSDHGTVRPERHVQIYTWLAHKGLTSLKPKSQGSLLKAKLQRHSTQHYNRGWQLLSKGVSEGINLLWPRLPNRLGIVLTQWLRSRYGFECGEIDLGRTSVVVGGSHQFYLLDPLKYGVGGLSPSRMSGFRDKLVGELLKLRDPVLGNPLFQSVAASSELFSGPYLHNAADLYVEPYQDLYWMATGRWARLDADPLVYRSASIAEHRTVGLWVAAGPAISRITERLDARIEDVFATTLYATHLPIPEHTDGRIFLDLFTPTFKERASRIASQAVSEESSSTDHRDVDAADRQHREDWLRGLGYL